MTGRPFLFMLVRDYPRARHAAPLDTFNTSLVGNEPLSDVTTRAGLGREVSAPTMPASFIT
jgi:hypothetical protein